MERLSLKLVDLPPTLLAHPPRRLVDRFTRLDHSWHAVVEALGGLQLADASEQELYCVSLLLSLFRQLAGRVRGTREGACFGWFAHRRRRGRACEAGPWVGHCLAMPWPATASIPTAGALSLS